MSKKALIVIMAAVLVLGAIGVMAQDGPGVINITLPDGKSVPVFTDGRLNAFDIAAPVVVYYTAANGTIVNPNFTTDQVDMVNLSNNSINANNVNGTNANPPANPEGLISKLQVLAIDPVTSNGNVVLEPTADDLLGLVTGQQKSISAKGYSVSYDRNSNSFFVQSPANFEGKVYTFAWPNNLFPLSLVGQQAQSAKQATPQPTAANTTTNGQATAQPTSQPAQPTPQPTAST